MTQLILEEKGQRAVVYFLPEDDKNALNCTHLKQKEKQNQIREVLLNWKLKKLRYI